MRYCPLDERSRRMLRPYGTITIAVMVAVMDGRRTREGKRRSVPAGQRNGCRGEAYGPEKWSIGRSIAPYASPSPRNSPKRGLLDGFGLPETRSIGRAHPETLFPGRYPVPMGQGEASGINVLSPGREIPPYASPLRCINGVLPVDDDRQWTTNYAVCFASFIQPGLTHPPRVRVDRV